MTDLQPKPLWQLGLDWLRDANGHGTHPLDRDRARKLVRGMRMLGEDPRYADVSAYVAERWSGWPHAASMTRKSWRSVYRTTTRLGREPRWDTPLYQPDRLIERHDLQPVTEERLAAVMHAAVDAVVESTALDGVAPYRSRRRELDATLAALEHLHFLRQGECGEPPRRPRWW